MTNQSFINRLGLTFAAMPQLCGGQLCAQHKAPKYNDRVLEMDIIIGLLNMRRM